MKRQLTNVEKNIVEKQINRLSEDLKYEEMLLEQAEFMINKKLPLEINKQRNEWLAKKRTTVENIKELQNGINELKLQISIGVEIKQEEKNGGDANNKKFN